jgi:hypothetical protein
VSTPEHPSHRSALSSSQYHFYSRSVSLAPNDVETVDGPCPGGTFVVAGGTLGSEVASLPTPNGNGWTAIVYNPFSTTLTAYVFAGCTG